MKAIIKFLLRTEAGKAIVQVIVSLVVQAFKKNVNKLSPERRVAFLNDLNFLHSSVHEEPIAADL
jgi:hypothetical protein